MSRTGAHRTTAAEGGNRWLILVAGVLVQLAIGAVYAWSVFAKALQSPQAFGWSKSLASVPFEIAIGMILVGTFIGGRIQDRRGPRVVALTGGVIYSVGVMLASFADKDTFWILLLGYGILGGFGLGMAYIVPIAMLQKWFSDKPGLITGIAVAGFGAVITAPLGQHLIAGDPSTPTKALLSGSGLPRGDRAGGQRVPQSHGARCLCCSPAGRHREHREDSRGPGAGGSGAGASAQHLGRPAHAAVVPHDRHPHPQRHGRHLADLRGRRERERRGGLLRCRGSQPGRHPRAVQRRGSHPLGVGLRPHRQDAGPHGHPRHQGDLPPPDPARLLGAPLRRPGRTGLHLLRRCLRRPVASSVSATPARSTV